VSSRPRHFVLSQPGPLRLYSTRELLAMPPPTWLIDGILPTGGFAALVGQPGAGKSFIALDMAMSVAAGGFWQGVPVQQGYVLYVSAEGGTGVGKRAKAWLLTKGLEAKDADLAWMVEPVYVRPGSEGMDTLLDRLNDELMQVPTLIVLDTLARCLEGDENQQEDMGRFVAGIDMLRKTYSCAILVVHHTRKDGEIERGSSSFRGAADTMLFASRPSKTGPITLSCTKQKDAEEFKPRMLQLRKVPQVDSCVIDGSKQQQQHVRTGEILQLLADHGPLSWDDWRSIAEDDGTTKTSFYRFFVELKENEEIIKENGKWRLNA
jgi:RecA-family ATPase